ncbi:MAG: hypothetical protein ACI4RO_04795, partial [Candidatus Scatosoma sp.]
EEWEAVKTIEKHINCAEDYNEYLPDVWRNITDEEKELGHGGMDYLEFKAFFKAVSDGGEMPIDVYDMAAWMAITPLSEQSIAHGGMPQAIPDFTRGKWMHRPTLDVTELPGAKGDANGEADKEESGTKNALGYSRG